MFYSSQPSNELRFGDVLRGFFSAIPVVKEPPFALSKKYEIELDLPEFYVIMDPCCQIRNFSISVTPLISIVPTLCSLFDNQYLAEDPTRINRVMKPEQSVPTDVWEKFPAEEKTRRLAVGERYAFLTLFVYEQNDLLPKHSCKKGQEDVTTGYYMIDFRRTHRVNCEKIISPEKSPLELKVLELSSETRQELSDKITSYYAIEEEE